MNVGSCSITVPQLKQFLLEENESNTIYPPSEHLTPSSRPLPIDSVSI